MADHVGLRVEVKCHAQPRRQTLQTVERVCVEFARFVIVADLDGDRVVVALVGAVGDLRKRHALEHLAVEPDEKMCARVGFPREGEPGEEAAVRLRRSRGVADVVDDHAVDLPQRRARTGVRIDGQRLDLHPLRRRDARTGDVSVAQKVYRFHDEEQRQHHDDDALEPKPLPAALLPVSHLTAAR